MDIEKDQNQSLNVGNNQNEAKNKNKITNETLYQFYILENLVEAGGKSATYRVMEKIGKKLKSSFSEKDLDDHKSGGVRWETNVRRARQHLIENGCLKNNSPHGVWEITDEGKKQYNEVLEYIRHTVKGQVK